NRLYLPGKCIEILIPGVKLLTEPNHPGRRCPPTRTPPGRERTTPSGGWHGATEALALPETMTVCDPPPPGFGHGTPGILVADDDAGVRNLLAIGLPYHGFRVWPAAGGFEALDLFGLHDPEVALALLDVQMPDLDGPRTLRALHALRP